VIQVIYRWKVQAGQEEAFTRAWTRGTRAIRSQCRGAHGSVLLRSHRNPAEFVGVASWESLADCQAFWRSPHPDPEAFRVVAETASFISREIFDELQDLECD
jgi:heme-degrading monooxygenase HmoA